MNDERRDEQGDGAEGRPARPPQQWTPAELERFLPRRPRDSSTRVIILNILVMACDSRSIEQDGGHAAAHARGRPRRGADEARSARRGRRDQLVADRLVLDGGALPSGGRRGRRSTASSRDARGRVVARVLDATLRPAQLLKLLQGPRRRARNLIVELRARSAPSHPQGGKLAGPRASSWSASTRSSDAPSSPSSRTSERINASRNFETRALAVRSRSQITGDGSRGAAARCSPRAPALLAVVPVAAEVRRARRVDLRGPRRIARDAQPACTRAVIRARARAAVVRGGRRLDRAARLEAVDRAAAHRDEPAAARAPSSYCPRVRSSP